MRLVIGRLGPVRDSVVELGDVTLFMGPPNTGKSYVLKALYAKLLPLDAYALRSLRGVLRGRLGPLLEGGLASIYSQPLQGLARVLSTAMVLAPFTGHEGLRGKVVELLNSVAGGAGFKSRLRVRGATLIVTLDAPAFSLMVDTGTIKSLVSQALGELASELVPGDPFDSVILEPIDIFKVQLQGVQGARRLVEPVNVDLWLLLRLIEGLKGGRESERPGGAGAWRVVNEYLSFLEDTGRRVKRPLAILISVNIVYGMEVTSVSGKLRFILKLPLQPAQPRMARLGAVSPDDLSSLVEAVGRDPEGSIQRVAASTIVRLVTSAIANSVGDAVSELILEGGFREALKESLKADSVVFIPFGRTAFILGLEGAVRDPYTSPEHLRHAIEEFYPTAYASYVYWASRGRSLLLKGKLGEAKARLLKAAMPLLEGEIVEGPSDRLYYRDWRGSLIDLPRSSALVQEVSGLLLALLGSKGSPLVLVEEPEAQLHPGAQVVMAFFLASLPGICGCGVAASTHSDLLAITLSLLKAQAPSVEQVRELLVKITPSVGDAVGVLADAVAKHARRIDLRIYEFTREGLIKPVKPGDVLAREVPGISRVVDELVEWAFSLTAPRESGEPG